VCYVDSNQGDLLARYVLDYKDETSAGVLLPAGDDAAMAMATAFVDRIEAETGNDEAIKVYEEYEAGAKDFSEQLYLVKESGVKSVLLPGDITDSAHIIKQAKTMGLDVVFMGDTEWTGKEFKKLVGNAATEENTAFVNFFSADETVNKEAEIFLKAYQEKYGAESVPEDGVALGYDAYIVALNAIDKAEDNATGEGIREVLATQTGFEGASGDITFNSMGDPIKTAYISTWRNDEVVSLYTLDPM
jgi:branched-chain amino acid transport system substrate-binding protein